MGNWAGPLHTPSSTLLVQRVLVSCNMGTQSCWSSTRWSTRHLHHASVTGTSPLNYNKLARPGARTWPGCRRLRDVPLVALLICLQLAQRLWDRQRTARYDATTRRQGQACSNPSTEMVWVRCNDSSPGTERRGHTTAMCRSLQTGCLQSHRVPPSGWQHRKKESDLG